MIDFPSLAGRGMISVDLETCDPDLVQKGSGAHRGSFIAGIAIATEDRSYKAYLPIGHESGENLPREPVLKWFAEQMRLDVPKVGANLLYDVGFCPEIASGGPLYDVQVAEPLIDGTRFRYGLDVLAKDYLGVGKHDEQLDDFLCSHFGKKNPKNSIWRAPSDIVAPYAIADAELALGIFEKQKPKLVSAGLWDLFEMERKLIPMLAEMRTRGVRVDIPAAEQMHKRLTQQQADIIAELKRDTGHDVAIWAADSIAKAFDAIGLTYPLTPKTKKPSFTAQFLETIEHPIAEMIKAARKLDKMRGTFLMGCLINGHHDGRIHCNFNQLRSDSGGAVSGRFSSSKPNLQFIPVRDKIGKEVRRMFKPDGDQVWQKFDYSQIEYVLMINDAAMFKVKGGAEIAAKYTNDEDADFHQIVAEMTGLDRQRAKTINFGLAYGEGTAKLCGQLGLSREAGEKMIAEYHRRAPFMRPLIDMWRWYAANKGEVRTIMNRRRTFDVWEFFDRKQQKQVFLQHRIPGSKRAFTHAALNARTQGSAADVMKKAMVDIYSTKSVLGVPHLTVHDELDYSTPLTREGYDACCEVKRRMEQCIQLLVPLRVDGEVGPNWGDTSSEYKEDIPQANRGGGIPDKTIKKNKIRFNGRNEDFEKWKQVALGIEKRKDEAA